MLSIGKVTDGNKTYHLDQVAEMTEEYYSGRGEAHGEWLGIEMQAYGVRGRVMREEFKQLIEGKRPDGELFSPYFSRRQVLAFDLTFSAPKSVSLMYAAGTPAVRDAVIAAHDKAMQAGLSYMESAVNFGRVREGGQIKPVAGNGLVAAAFRHRTNRLGEPQLHTHVVTPNLIQLKADKWSTLDGNRIYNHAVAGGTIYQSALRAELTKTLGVEWQEVVKGQADVAGFSRETIEAFSTRRDEIEAELFDRGWSSSDQARLAATRTRLTKEQSKVKEDMFESWDGLLKKEGVTPEFIDGLCGRSYSATRFRKAQMNDLFDTIDDKILKTRAYVDRRDVLQAIADNAPAVMEVQHLNELADAWISSRGVSISEQGHGPVQHTQKTIAAGNRVVTTPEQIAREDELLDAVDNRVANKAGLVPAAVLKHGLKKHAAHLSEDQRAMIEHILTSGNGVDAVIGDAGTGKTTAMKVLRQIYEDAGYRMVGAALAARAARELGDGAAINSETIHQTLKQLSKAQSDRRFRPSKTVLVIDEAAMVDTELLHALVTHRATRKMKIVMIGDDKQLPAIGPGGAFRAIVSRLGAPRLTENFRQQTSEGQAIVAEFRDGNGARGLQLAHEADLLVVTDTHDDALDALYDGWSADVARGGETLMIAGLHTEVQALNVRAQADRLARNELGSESIDCGLYRYRVGDTVRCGARDPHWRVANGDFGTVKMIDTEAHTVTIEVVRDGQAREVILRSKYINNPEKFKLGYAITAHTAQGATVDNAWTLWNDRTYRELAYVMSSRARWDTHIVVVGSPVIDADAPGFAADAMLDPEDPRLADVDEVTEFDLVVSALRNSQAQAFAADVGKADLFADTPTQDLVIQIFQARAAIAEDVANRVDGAITGSGSNVPDHVELSPEEVRDTQRYRDLVNEIKLRTEHLVRRQMARPPRYLTAELGPLPKDPASQEYWRRGALEIELYRARWEISDKTFAWARTSHKSSPFVSSEFEAIKGRHAAAAMRRATTFKAAIEHAPVSIEGPSL